MTFEKAYKQLIIKEPFYGLFLMTLNKVISTKVPTLAVRQKGIFVELVINPEFWETLKDQEQVAVLKHECLHICFSHLFMYDFFENKEILGIAADLEVNSYIENLPKNALLPKDYNMGPGMGLKYYYENLINSANAVDCKGVTLDDHSSWEDIANSSQTKQALIKAQIEHVMKNSADQCLSQRGNIPGEMLRIINALREKKPRVYDWKKYFRRMLGFSYDVNIKRTRKRESRRFAGAKGIIHKKRVSLLVCIDTSGSISSSLLRDFFNELDYIYDAGAFIKILECDTLINKEYIYTKQTIENVSGGGGTILRDTYQYYLDHKREYNGFVIFTDGYCDDPSSYGIPANDFMWLIYGNNNVSFPGKKIYINNNN